MRSDERHAGALRDRPILRETLPVGRVADDVPPLALGVAVSMSTVEWCQAALAAFLHPDEELLCVVRLQGDAGWLVRADHDWLLYFVLTEHHFCRVAFPMDHSEARVLAAAYEYLWSSSHSQGAIEIGVPDHMNLLIGRLAHRRDSVVISAAEYYLRLPPGSDGSRSFAEQAPVKSGAVSLIDLTSAMMWHGNDTPTHGGPQ